MDVPLIIDRMIIKVSLERKTEDEYYYGISDDFEINNKRGIDKIGFFYNKFHKINQEFSAEHHPSSVEIGVNSISHKNGYYNYYAGKRVKNRNSGIKYDLFILKKGLYLKCTFTASDFDTLVSDCVYKATDYMMNTWIKESNYKVTGNNPFKDNMKYNNEFPNMCERYFENKNREKIPQMDLLFPVKKT